MPIFLSPAFKDPFRIFFGSTAIREIHNGANKVWEINENALEITFDKIPDGFDYSAIITDSGLLYSFAVAEDSRNIAPPGWHVASYYEWMDMRTYIGINNSHKLKSVGSVYWDPPKDDGENLHNFNAIANGLRQSNDIINSYGTSAYWWSGTHDLWSPSLYSGMYVSLGYNSGYVHDIISSSYAPGYTGYGLRMVKDDNNDPGTMTDNDGNVYSTVTINGVVWTTSNHKGIKFRNGDTIPYFSMYDAWDHTAIAPRYCYPRKREIRDLTVEEWNQAFVVDSYTSMFTNLEIDKPNNKIKLYGGVDLANFRYNKWSPVFRKFDTSVILVNDKSFFCITSISTALFNSFPGTKNYKFSSMQSIDLHIFNYATLITLGFPEITDSANIYVSGGGNTITVELLYLDSLLNIPAIFGSNGIDGTKLKYINMSSTLTFDPYYVTYSCFYAVQNNVLTIVINPTLMTSNNGGIDPDIQYLIDHNTLTILDPSLNQIYP